MVQYYVNIEYCILHKGSQVSPCVLVCHVQVMHISVNMWVYVSGCEILNWYN